MIKVPCDTPLLAAGQFNQLIRIEELLGEKAVFAGKKAFKNA